MPHSSFDALSNGVDADVDGAIAPAQSYQLSHHLFDLHLEQVE